MNSGPANNLIFQASKMMGISNGGDGSRSSQMQSSFSNVSGEMHESSME